MNSDLEQGGKTLKAVVENGRGSSPNGPRGKKNPYRKDSDSGEESQSNKQ